MNDQLAIDAARAALREHIKAELEDDGYAGCVNACLMELFLLGFVAGQAAPKLPTTIIIRDADDNEGWKQ